MKIIKECQYDNTELDYGDIVIFDDENGCYKLWMIKSTYHDWNTDCSWHYVMTQNGEKDLDLCWSDIKMRLEWDEVWILKNLILTWQIREDPNDKLIEINNDIDYYNEKINDSKSKISNYEYFLREKFDEYKKLTWNKHELDNR